LTFICSFGGRRNVCSLCWALSLQNISKAATAQGSFADLADVPGKPCEEYGVSGLFHGADHDRRRILQFGVTAHPTAEWTVQQLRNAFPWESVPRYLLRDRDRIFGEEFVRQVKAMGIKQVLSAPRSPWQRAYVKRLIGSIRREGLDHVVVFNESSLRRTLTAYCGYYHNWRTHLSLGKDAPEARRVQFVTEGEVVEMPAMGGLHHRYERRAA